MPISPAMWARYPEDWALRSRFVREYRAGNRCEWCAARNYAVGQRVGGGFRPAHGNLILDLAGCALAYPSYQPITYREAREIADELNFCNNGDPYIVIVLTVAHVFDHRPEAASLLNLAALCQRCHNRHDRAHRLASSRARRHTGQLDLGL